MTHNYLTLGTNLNKKKGQIHIINIIYNYTLSIVLFVLYILYYYNILIYSKLYRTKYRTNQEQHGTNELKVPTLYVYTYN